MIHYQNLTVIRKAGADLTDDEGCFVTADATAGTTVNLATAGTTPAQVCGLLDTTATQGEDVTVILPGFSGIPAAKLHSSSADAKPGDTLALAANGTVKVAATGTLVAVAVEPGTKGHMVAVRLIEPRTVTASTGN